MICLLKGLWTLLKVALITVLLVVVGLAAPVAYIETSCSPKGTLEPYEALTPAENHRAEGRSLLTYPEWHIVHAYEEYSEVIRTEDPHDFGFLSSISGFWSSLCSLSGASGPHGGFPGEFKSTIYTIGVSFTAEMLVKAAYEETFGRAMTWVRGAPRSALDDLSASQAKAYSQFLRQTPWYKWDFNTDAAALEAHPADRPRDAERRIALGLEYRVKAKYARVIAGAVANMEPDALRLRMVITGLNALEIGAYEGVRVIQRRPEGTVIETPRYRALTGILKRMADDGANFVEIAGNDDIMLSVLSDMPLEGAVYTAPRQGFGDMRHLMVTKVDGLARLLRQLEGRDLKLEHIHDY